MIPHKICFGRDFIYSLLQECTQSKDVAIARHAYFLILSCGLDTVSVLGDHLIRAFTSCGCLIEAHDVFSRIPNPTVYTWNSIISAHTKLGDCNTSICIYHRMASTGFEPDRVTFLTVLKACSSVNEPQHGMVVHDHIIRTGLESQRTVQNTLVDMYAKNGNIYEAHNVFDLLGSRRNEVTWNAMIVGYVQCGQVIPALELLKLMKSEGLNPDKMLFLYVIKACTISGEIELGRLCHEQIKSCGLEREVVIGSALLDMYSKCGSLEEACKVFNEVQCRTVVTWGAMIAAYVEHAHNVAALECFEKMQQEAVQPDEAVFSSVLKACGSLGTVELGRLIHDCMLRCSLQLDVVLGNNLIYLYAKCGNLVDAFKVFHDLPDKDDVSWGTMITGYVRHECPFEAIELFEKMQEKGLPISNVIYVGILKACGRVGAVMQGRSMHDNLIRNCAGYDVLLDNALIDMYSKCGSLREAHRVLDMVLNPDLVSWSAMIAGYAEQGDKHMVEHCLKSILQQGLKADAGVFTSVLTASSHAGLVDEGHRFLKHNMDELGLALDVQHLNCSIDYLGRAGCLKEAASLIHATPLASDVVGWRSLLNGCKTYGDSELGQRCLLSLESNAIMHM